eukprot:gene26890-35273_t
MEDPLALKSLITRITALAQKKADAETLLKSLQSNITELDTALAAKQKQVAELDLLIEDTKLQTNQLIDEKSRTTVELQQEKATSSKMKGTLEKMAEQIKCLENKMEEENLVRSDQLKTFEEIFRSHESIAAGFTLD